MEIKSKMTQPPARFGKHDAKILYDVVMGVEGALVKLHSAIGTTQLVRLMIPEHTQEEMNNCVAWLRLARSMDELKGCFTHGKPASGTFGKPRILWLLDASRRKDVEDYLEM